MKKSIFTILLLFVAIDVIATEFSESEKPLDVIVQPVTTRKLQNDIEALGNLHANEAVDLTAKVTKVITRINFEDGQRVDKGAILIEMINTEEAALMDEARYTAEEAKKQLDRNQALAKKGAVSDATLDQLQRQYATAHAHFLALQSRFQDSLVMAPFSGVIGLRDIGLGSLVAPGQTITTLVDDTKMKLDFIVPAFYLSSLRKGLSVKAISHDLGDKVYQGSIASIDNQIDEATRSIKVRAVLDNASHELKQGLLISVVLHADIRKSLVISEAALVPMGSNNFVFVLRPRINHNQTQWIAEKCQVKIGRRTSGVVEIVDGLVEGDKVVTHGLQKIHIGQILHIMAEEVNNSEEAVATLTDLLSKKVSEGK